MKKLVPAIVSFSLAVLMFALAGLELTLGFAFGGRSGHQRRIYMDDEPVKFWTIVSIPLIVGAVAFFLGLVSLLKNRRRRN